MWNCSLCGHSNPDNAAMFCGRCGTRRVAVRTNYREADISGGTIAYAWSAFTSVSMSGSFSSWLYDELKLRKVPDREIVPLRQDVLEFAKQQPLVWQIIDDKMQQGETAILSYAKEKKRRARASDIVSGMVQANQLFEDRRKAQLFRLDKADILERLHNPCRSADDFAGKIASLASLFEVPLGPLRSLVRDAQRDWKAIKLVEEMLKSEGVGFDSDMIKTWRNIIALRNAAPLHAHDAPIPSLEFFGVSFPLDYQRLWDSILDKFLYSLRKFIEVLVELRKSTRQTKQ